MTEREYLLFIKGRNNSEQKDLQYLRKICWTITCSYADPKKLPANERVWWPLESDPKIKPMSRAKIKKLHSKFKKLKWQRQG